jgi:hypothetical protein
VGDVPAGEPTWRVGRRCESGACVEVGVLGEVVVVRSSEAPDVIFSISKAEWRDFLTGAKEGVFDQL